MTASVHLTRAVGAVMELRRRPFHVLLDGADIGTIELHQTVEHPVEPGSHTLQVTAGRYRSRRHSFAVADGEVAHFRCNGAVIWPIYLASFVKPDLALTLRRE